jgi:hypothetical protein
MFGNQILSIACNDSGFARPLVAFTAPLWSTGARERLFKNVTESWKSPKVKWVAHRVVASIAIWDQAGQGARERVLTID